MSAFYNENDPYAAQWLRNLIAAGHIAPGVVDERSVADIDADDLDGFEQCHFFAGIGVWSRALRLAGWPDDRAVWTGSCPCQPFSKAGKGRGHEDERHLWPAWFRLVTLRRPATVLGEQVASNDGRAWLDLVLDDMERAAYAVAAADLPAAGVGAPHIRQRLFFVAHDDRAGREVVGAARLHDAPGHAQLHDAHGRGALGVVGHALGPRLEGLARHGDEPGGWQVTHRPVAEAGALGGFWRDAEWIACRDGTRRPVEPGTFPLAHGVANRMGRLRAYGNALVAQQAGAFIEAVMEVTT